MHLYNTATFQLQKSLQVLTDNLYLNTVTIISFYLETSECSTDGVNIIVKTKGDCTGGKGGSGGGTVYTRWGRTVCPNTAGTELVYKGLAAGTNYLRSGGGANYLCATEAPQYLTSAVPRFRANDLIFNYLHGSEYQVKGVSSLHDQNVPCAVCYTSQRSAKLMIPGRITCPQSWTEEYVGYLMSERDHPAHKHANVYECVDKNGEAVPGEQRDSNGALFQLVSVACNVGLPCAPNKYIPNRPITCVVCTK